MVNKKSKNVGTSNSGMVNTASNNISGNGTNPARTARNRRNRAAKAARSRAATSGVVTNTSGAILADIQSMDSGRMTSDVSSDLSFIRSLRGECCGMDENTEGWYFKYLDPAGAVETARAIGEFSKIPDGLLTFSVDAEIRLVDQLPPPNIDASILPLDGHTWSLTIFSYPMFRTAYIAIANILDKEISTAIAADLAFTLNNLTDYRQTIDQDNWAPFAQEIEAGWFYWIKPLPPTYNLPDPQQGDVRTLTSWRMSYKSLTIEHNAPTLVDQGFWNGGHYALDSSIVQQPTRQTTNIASFIHGVSTVEVLPNVGGAAAFRYNVRIPNLPQVLAVTGPAVINTSFSSFYLRVTGDNSASGTPVTWTVLPGTAIYNPFEVVFAEPGDTVSMVVSVVATNIVVTFTSSNAGSPVPIVLTFLSSQGGTVVYQNTEAITEIFVDDMVDEFQGRTSNQIEFPAYTPAQIAANNPKMEQFLMKETNGAYVVHKKMRKPVFEVTPASSFGPIQFTTPTYDTTRNTQDGSGILDTIDANFSTASVCIRGISTSNVPIVKLYQGWEGVTNVNTPFGQFGHTGLPRNNCVMELVDNLTVRTTGVYPANDNFLGLIAKFAAGALRSLLSSEATPQLLGKLAQGVINKGVGAARRRMGQPKDSVRLYA